MLVLFFSTLLSPLLAMTTVVAAFLQRGFLSGGPERAGDSD